MEKASSGNALNCVLNYFTGHPLQYKQSDIGIKGWAVESRVYAEVRKFENPNLLQPVPT